MIAKAALAALVAVVATGAAAQARRLRPLPRAKETAPPAASIDKRDRLVAAPGEFNGRPYWLALAQCGGIYFRLDALYTDAAVRARVVKPDSKANAEFTKRLNDAIKTATAYFDAAERFLMSDRHVERADAVLTYDEQSRAAGAGLKTIDTALAAAKPCPALYRACREAHPKECREPLAHRN